MENEKLVASVAGVVDRVNKLICVKPFKTRYNGEVGDVVVGRITEVQQKRWKVDTNARLDSILMLSSVNLPGGELVSTYFPEAVYSSEEIIVYPKDTCSTTPKKSSEILCCAIIY